MKNYMAFALNGGILAVSEKDGSCYITPHGSVFGYIAKNRKDIISKIRQYNKGKKSPEKTKFTLRETYE